MTVAELIEALKNLPQDVQVTAQDEVYLYGVNSVTLEAAYGIGDNRYAIAWMPKNEQCKVVLLDNR